MEIVPNSYAENNEQLENDHLKRLNRCRKYSNHSDMFIPIKQFGMDHLPDDVRCPIVLRWIKDQAAETVRLVVNFTSGERPENLKVPNISGGSTHKRYGTGSLRRLGTSGLKGINATPARGIGGRTFFVETAAHVIFNDEEARSSTVEFLFDDDSDRSEVIIASVKRVVDVDFSMIRTSLTIQAYNYFYWNKRYLYIFAFIGVLSFMHIFVNVLA